MDIKSEVRNLQVNRLLRTEEEIDVYEESLSRLVKTGDVALIKEMLSGFDDETEHHEVTFSLIHGIEFLYQNDIEEGLLQIATAVPDVLPFAREWVEILHYRILNHPEDREIYSRVLQNLDENLRLTIVGLLEDISKENPDKFQKAVDEVLSRVASKN